MSRRRPAACAQRSLHRQTGGSAPPLVRILWEPQSLLPKCGQPGTSSGASQQSQAGRRKVPEDGVVPHRRPRTAAPGASLRAELREGMPRAPGTPRKAAADLQTSRAREPESLYQP